MKKLKKFFKKRKKAFIISLSIIFALSFGISWYWIKAAQNNDYKYYTMPNGTMIKYKGKELVPDKNGIIVIPKGGASIIMPE